MRDELTGVFRLDAVLQRRNGEAVAEHPNLSLAEVLDGFSWGVDGARWRPAEIEPFLGVEGSFVTGARYLRTEDERIAVVLRNEDLAALVSRLGGADEVQQLRLEGELSGSTLIAFRPGELWGSQLFDELGLQCVGGKPTLVGGMKVACKRERVGYFIEAPPRLWLPGAGHWKIDCMLPSGHIVSAQFNVTAETSKTLAEIVGTAEVTRGRYRVSLWRADVADYVAEERTFSLCAEVEDARSRTERPEVAYVIDPAGKAFSSLRLPATAAVARVIVGARAVSVADL